MRIQFPAIKLDFPPLRAKALRQLDIEAPMPEFRAPTVGNVVVSVNGVGYPHVPAIDSQIATLFASVDWGDDVDYGPEFVTPTPALRETAKAFVERLAHASIDCFGRPIPIPEVSPAADGSIDLHWGDGEARELLLGIRTTGTLASYFGRDRDGDSIKGTLQIDQRNEFLASWLISAHT